MKPSELEGGNHRGNVKIKGADQEKTGLPEPGAAQDQDYVIPVIRLKKKKKKKNMSGREERPQSSEETQSSPAPITSTAPPATTAGISHGTVARARERIQQQAHSSSPSQTGSTRSRTSQLTLGQTAHPQSLLPGDEANMLHRYQNKLTLVDTATTATTISKISIPISSIYREIQPEASETSSVSFVPKRQRSPEGAPIPQTKCLCHWYIN